MNSWFCIINWRNTRLLRIVTMLVIAFVAGAVNRPAWARNAVSAPYVANSVLLSLPEGVDANEAASVISSQGIGVVDSRDVTVLTDGLVEVSLTDGATVEQAIKQLESSSMIEYAQPDYIYTTMSEQDAWGSLLDDPLLRYQWGVTSVGAPTAWRLAYAGGSTHVGVAIMDTGFFVGHEDLASSIPPNAPYNAYYASQDKTGVELQDVAPGPTMVDHGMHVAGIVAASGGNNTGVAGIAYGAWIVPIRVYNYETGSASGATTSALLKAYDYVMDHQDQFNIRVVNMSLGVRMSSAFPVDDLLLSKIDEAFEQGIVTVASAGNNASSGPYDCYPGDYHTVVSVMNLQTTTKTTSDGGIAFEDPMAVTLSYGSNYNAPGEQDKNICAPGKQILSTVSMDSGKLSAYSYMSGTSMSAPHVAGVLALMFAVCPNMTAQEAVNVLYATARDIGEPGWDETYGYGEVDARAALSTLCLGGQEGWVDLAGNAKGYARNGELVTGWMDLVSAKHWFESDGAMATGWTNLVIAGKTMHYYFNPSSGNLVRDTWFRIEGKTYYFRPSGNLATGWVTLNDKGVEKKYYLDEYGQLVTGWRDIEENGKTMHYYFRPSGAMATGWAEIDSQSYFFRPSGNMATGWADVPDDEFKRYFDENGRMLTGWQTIGGKTYYFRESGAMQTGTTTIDGAEYTFSNKGVLVS